MLKSEQNSLSCHFKILIAEFYFSATLCENQIYPCGISTDLPKGCFMCSSWTDGSQVSHVKIFYSHVRDLSFNTQAYGLEGFTKRNTKKQGGSGVGSLKKKFGWGLQRWILIYGADWIELCNSKPGNLLDKELCWDCQHCSCWLYHKSNIYHCLSSLFEW